MILEENLYHGAGIIRYLFVCFIKKCECDFVHFKSPLELSFHSFHRDEPLSVIYIFHPFGFLGEEKNCPDNALPLLDLATETLNPYTY